MNKIAILLPLKERYRKFDAGSVSLFVHSHLKNSRFKKNIKIYGYSINNTLDKNYVGLNSNKFFLTNFFFLNSFASNINEEIQLIELHNRPKYFIYLKKKFPQKKFVFFFHNDPNTLSGSQSVVEKQYLLKNCDQIIFLSQWMKKEFFKDLNVKNSRNTKVVYPGVNPIKKFPEKKKKIIVFIGKLNKAKGYDLYLNAVSKFLLTNKDWKGFSIGDESRRDIPVNSFVKELGLMSNDKVLKFLENSSIAVANSTSEEPFGRLPLESASRGSFPIVSKRGGLTETITNKLSILKKNTSHELYKKLLFLKSNPKRLLSFQINVFRNFKLTLKSQTALLDQVRKFIL